MGINKFFVDLNDLEKMVRCPGKHKLVEHNVSAHSFKVSQYGMFFAEIEEQAGVIINWKSLFEKLSSHDIPEIWVSDIPTPIKHFSLELNQMIQHVEESLVDSYIYSEIPIEFQQVFKRRLKNHKDESTEGWILTLSDKLDQFYEAYVEITLGNPVEAYRSMLLNALESILTLGSKLPTSVTYLIDFILPDAFEAIYKADVNVWMRAKEALETYKDTLKKATEVVEMVNRI